MRRLLLSATTTAACGALTVQRGTMYPMAAYYDHQSAGRHDLAPRDDTDFVLTGSDEQVIPGAHPLPLPFAENSLTLPLVSPYMPSPQRVHPYWLEPPAEFPHFGATVPIVYPFGIMKERIIVPVFTLDGRISHTRELDPFVFGRYPSSELMSKNSTYWQVRSQMFSSMWEHERREIWRKAKKNWANTGTGLPRVSDRRSANFEWGARTRPMKPWNMLMPTMDVMTWHNTNRMAMTLKMLQGKLMVVDRLTLPEPSVPAFHALCRKMRWDVRHTGGGVLFMDGGSRLMPSLEFDMNFFYGSFINGRAKIVRPTVLCDTPYDYNRTSSKQKTRTPKGQKNPIPINRFNVYDALKHHHLVLTEGAVVQLEREMHHHKLLSLPPHIRNQMPQMGMLDAPVLGDAPMPLETIEMEAAARTEEIESSMYEPYYDNPYKPWADEQQASYVVDAVEGSVTRHVDGKKTSWKMLE